MPTPLTASTSTNALYTDLSAYYDLMCLDIDYASQSQCVARLHQLFGNQGRLHLDLACGSGPHIRHFLDQGFSSRGLDLNQPMLDLARKRCPEAQFDCQDMCSFSLDQGQDLITCFLYSLHYSGETTKLQACIQQVHQALNSGGLFCFNSVDKGQIDNHSFARHSVQQPDSELTFTSGWYYRGEGDRQSLRLSIHKQSGEEQQHWQDEHPMVATSFTEMTTLLSPYFDVQLFEHDYQRLLPWQGQTGNAIFVCIKRDAVLSPNASLPC